jgi:hypothetical protein
MEQVLFTHKQSICPAPHTSHRPRSVRARSAIIQQLQLSSISAKGHEAHRQGPPSSREPLQRLFEAGAVSSEVA